MTTSQTAESSLSQLLEDAYLANFVDLVILKGTIYSQPDSSKPGMFETAVEGDAVLEELLAELRETTPLAELRGGQNMRGTFTLGANGAELHYRAYLYQLDGELNAALRIDGAEER